MVEQIVSLETAKLAYSKGFRHNKTSVSTIYDLGDNSVSTHAILGYLMQIEEGVDYLFAPTQSLLQKWLRDNHGVDFSIDYFYGWQGEIEMYKKALESKPEDGALSRRNIFMPIHNEGSSMFNTYEETLEKGLLEALKLI